MTTQQIDDSSRFFHGDQPTTCPLCGARTEILLDLSHTISQVQVQKCLDKNCSFEFFAEVNEDDLIPKVELCYLYRDASNYKLFNSVVFENPECIPLAQIESTIRGHLIDGEFFNPIKWGLPKPEFDDFNVEDDHDWCEFEKIAPTEMETDSEVTIAEFLEIVEGRKLPQT
ncbi:MAG: hypothetical protein IPN76_28590 [Saprospiraceae bacterium]|nr:hypothetical protein [Saprospiraceae bacterium]